MNELKHNLQNKLLKGELTQIEHFIEEYTSRYPHDLDLFSIKTNYYLLTNHLSLALHYAKMGVRKSPYNAEMNYNLAIIYERQEEYFEAFRYYSIAFGLAHYANIQDILSLDKELIFSNLIEKIIERADHIADTALLKEYQQQIIHMKKKESVLFGLSDFAFWNPIDVVGDFYEDSSGNRKFVAKYEVLGLDNFDLFDGKDGNTTKLELLEANFTNTYHFDYQHTTALLPIASPEANTIYKIHNISVSPADKKSPLFKEADGENSLNILQKKKNHFNYYRLEQSVDITAEKNVYFGKPIFLEHAPDRKKLVLNIFVDGLSQKILEEEGMDSMMPHTKHFFSKGIICNKAYSTSEWTYPAMATYMTGLYTTGHMMMHNTLLTHLPDDVTLLSEYFQNKGYHTAKIDGDWRNTVVYGYGRGMDRILYQHQNIGMKVETVISDTISNLDMMKETDQFVYCGIGDLHDIADGFELPGFVQAGIPIQFRSMEEVGTTSAKQKYSISKRLAYIKQVKRIDRCLKSLYQYIEDNYSDNEILISLFSDHGQGYFLKPDEHFLSHGRSNVALMFRSNFKKHTICEELISTCDYKNIMCKLADITMKQENIDGILPKFFGGQKEREYVLTESIHPGDPYMAALFTKNENFFLTMDGAAQQDGRFHTGELHTQLIDNSGKELENEEQKQYNTAIIMEHIAGNIIY